MLFLTHLLFSLIAGTLLSVSFPSIPSFVFISVCAFFGVFPDIDSLRSKIGTWVPFSKTASFILGHRGIFHSLIIPASLWLMSGFLGKTEVAIAIVAGYSSHLFLDALTPKGIAPLYPFSKYRLSGPVKTASWAEYGLLFLFIIILMIISLHK